MLTYNACEPPGPGYYFKGAINMNNQARFWDWIAQRYARQPIADEPAYLEKLSRIRALLNEQSHVLEFGCGTGSTAISLAPCAGHIRATDISSNMIAIAREKAAAAEIGNISFETGALRDHASEIAKWDMVIGMNVLHLVPDLGGDIGVAYKLLKPGGTFISGSPCIRDMSGPIRFLMPFFRWLPFIPTVSAFTQGELMKAIQGAGFSIDSSWLPGKNKAVFIVARKPSDDR